ncbi:hypothetical protein Mapa_015080 [Marchantia paleacea]|nr:hypothetical protein Mapa_015080 [Marchantia paleacea]
MPEVTHLDKLHFIVYIFGPKFPVLIECEIKPRFHVSVVMNDRCAFDLINRNARIVS